MKATIRVFAALALIFAASAAAAQDFFWVQIEARPGRPQAAARAQDWDGRLDNVAAFNTGGRWNAIVVGPFATENQARAELLNLRAQRLVPSDSFVVSGRAFRDQIFGTPGPALQPGAQVAAPLPEPEPLLPTEETVAEARAAERQLTRDAKRELQQALQYDGFYRSTIDGAFGPGTRRAIEGWQTANRFEATGFLTSKQRAQLINSYRGDIASLGLTPVFDERAGIQIDLPLGILGDPVYAPPFARYEAKDGSGAMVMLISQAGNQTTLFGLYDVMQTLEVVPLDGERQRGRNSFLLTGADDNITSHTVARVEGDTVKGFTLIWPADDLKRRGLVLTAMERSFNAVDGVLPDDFGDTSQSIDLLSGLEIRRPQKSRSGFFVSGSGAVVTTTDSLGTCSRLTIGEETSAEIAARDDDLGLVLLQPSTNLAPLAVARFVTVSPRLQSDVAVAGYSFGGALGAPTLTYGTLADIKGLRGEDNQERLSLPAEPGDVGGPVFNEAGGVVGILQARDTTGGQVLPGDVNFAADAVAVAEFLSNGGVSAAASDAGSAALAPEDLARLAADVTVLVNCWD